MCHCKLLRYMVHMLVRVSASYFSPTEHITLHYFLFCTLFYKKFMSCNQIIWYGAWQKRSSDEKDKLTANLVSLIPNYWTAFLVFFFEVLQ